MISDCIKSALPMIFQMEQRMFAFKDRHYCVPPKVAEGSCKGNGPCRKGAQAERIQRRLWVLLNMETPEKKPVSSTAKRPRVTESAATSLHRGRELAQAFGISKSPPLPLLLNSDHPVPSAH